MLVSQMQQDGVICTSFVSDYRFDTMIQIFKEECLIVNFNEHDNGDLFVVFMIPGRGFLKGILKAEMRRFVGEIKHFHYASISYYDLQDESGLKAISELKMRQPADLSPPAF